MTKNKTNQQNETKTWCFAHSSKFCAEKKTLGNTSGYQLAFSRLNWWIRGSVSKRTGAASVRELYTRIDHRTGFLKLAIQALALRQSDNWWMMWSDDGGCKDKYGEGDGPGVTVTVAVKPVEVTVCNGIGDGYESVGEATNIKRWKKLYPGLRRIKESMAHWSKTNLKLMNNPWITEKFLLFDLQCLPH